MIAMKHIKEVIEEKYTKEYFQKMGRKWWDDLSPEDREEHKKRLKEASKRGGETMRKKFGLSPEPEGVVKTHSQRVMESQKRYPEKNSARGAIRREVKKGRMKKASELFCVDCGNQAKEYDHAYGYEKENWLKVDPVCVKCHKKRGVKRGEHGGSLQS